MKTLRSFILAALLSTLFGSGAMAAAVCPFFSMRAQVVTASSYTISGADQCKLLVFSANGSSVALPAPGSSGDLTAGYTTRLFNDTSGTLAVAGTVNGSVSPTIAVGATLDLYTDGTVWYGASTGSSSGSGDVVGPASATSGNLASYNGTTGKLIQDSNITSSSVLVNGGPLGTPSSGVATNLTSIPSAALTGTISVNRFNSGTGASSLTYLSGAGTWTTPAGTGTVTSVGLSVPGTSLFGVTGTPVTGTGTLGLTTTGTSGGIPYFSSTSQLATSAALTANQIVLGGGAGTAPAALGSLGTTTTLLHGNAAGAPTFGAVSLTADISNILPVANGGTNAGSASGTALDNITGFSSTGLLSRTGSGTYAQRTITGTANRISLSNGDGVSGNPTIDVDAAYAGQSSITTLGTIGTGTWAGTTISVDHGGTGLVAGTSGGVPYYSGSTTIASSGALTASRLVLGGGAGSAPTVLGSLGTTTTLLHGNAAGAPTFGAVDVTTDITGVVPAANGGAGTLNGVLQANGSGTVSVAAAGTVFAAAVPAAIGWSATADPLKAVMFTASRAMTVIDLRGTVGVAVGTAAAITVYKAPSGTACNSGTAQHSGTFDANGTPATNQTLTLAGGGANVLAAGDRLCLYTADSAAFIANVGVGGITATLQVQ